MKPYTRGELENASCVLCARELPLRLQDIDGARVIFFTRPLEFFHDLMMEFLAERGYPFSQVMEQDEWLMPLRHTEADYLAPLRMGDRVRVELVRVEMDETEAAFGFRMLRQSDNRVAAVGQTIHVCVDAKTFRRKPFPEEVRRALTRREG